MADTQKLDDLINSYWGLLDDVKKLVAKMSREPNPEIRYELNRSLRKLDAEGAELQAQIQDEVDRLWKENP